MSLHHQHYNYKQSTSATQQSAVPTATASGPNAGGHFGLQSSSAVPPSAATAAAASIRQMPVGINQNFNLNSQNSSEFNGPNSTMAINAHQSVVSNQNGKIVTKVEAYSLQHNDSLVELYVSTDQMFDRGAFGVVFRARLPKENDRLVAIKQVHQDKRYRNRELPLMKQLCHQNIVTLLYYYYTLSSMDNQKLIYLNLVMEFMPQNLNYLIRLRKKEKRNAQLSDIHAISTTPFITIKLFMYQIFRALAYIHSKGICHRDIKPNNLLFNPETGVLKICDFGSAKYLVPGERNVSYICARYYRAPELLFGATDYTNMIDMWSTGVVFSELLLGYPIFHEDSGIDQLVLIISKLGTPTKEQIRAMNKSYAKYDLPQVYCPPMQTLFPMNTPPDALDLISNLFQYDPHQRIRPLRACAHQFFDELREPGKKWVNGRDLPPLFDFTDHERMIDPAINSRLMPFTSKHTPNAPIPVAIQQQNATAYQLKTLTNRPSGCVNKQSSTIHYQPHQANQPMFANQPHASQSQQQAAAANFLYNHVQQTQYPSTSMTGSTASEMNNAGMPNYPIVDHSAGINYTGSMCQAGPISGSSSTGTARPGDEQVNGE